MVPEPRHRRIPLGDVELAVYEWAGDAPTVLLLHATGFHARCWDGVVAELPGAHVVAVDLRGHGQSTKRPPYEWDQLGKDATSLCHALGSDGWLGVGHSMGGHVVVQVAAARPESFAELILVDPVILAPEAYEASSDLEGRVHYTAKRRNHFASPAAMYERFRDRPPYSAWKPDVLRAYCEHGLVPGPDGGYVLACPPEVEAAIYTTSRGHDIHASLPTIQVPVTVLRARAREGIPEAIDFSSSPTWPQLARRFPAGRDEHHPDASHFLPMEVPERVAACVRDARQRISTSRSE